ncbi:MAG: hypothetical protein K0R85_300 [Devosia sp.]|jgi:hypothetical protein|nr:hypothetical protein [Devosia sp.]
MKTEVLSLALDHGFAVFPVRPRSKVPLIKGWPEAATTDEHQINEWWDVYPDANVGIATGAKSGVLVMDIDIETGGMESLENLMAHEEWVDTRSVRTGTGGLHFYYEFNPSNPIRNSVSLIAPGIDIRGEGGFVLAPPSIHPNGTPYVWIK